MRALVGWLVALAACAPETTAFRTTDRGDDRGASYDVTASGLAIAHVRVWSNGGYIGSSDEPMTHLGFEIANASKHAVIFDGDSLALELSDAAGTALPPARLSAIVPLGAAQVAVPAGGVTTLDAYFVLPVRPRNVDAMRARWRLKIDDESYARATPFVRSDEL